MRVFVITVAVIVGWAAVTRSESCGSHGSPRFESLCCNVNNSYECAKKIELAELENSSRGVARTESFLRIPLDSSDIVQLEDEHPEEADEVLLYAYREFLPGINSHVVQVSLWESAYFLLFEASSGRRTRIDAPPVVSPDKRRFAIASRYNPNVVQVWKLEVGVPKLEFETKPSEWEPLAVQWRGPSELVVDHTTLGNGPTGKSTTYVRLPSGWRARGSESPENDL